MHAGWVFVFRQDGTPAHRARDTVAFLKRKVGLLDFIPQALWPTNSPDLNPVDCSICSVLQEKVYPSRIANVHLKTRVFDEWERFDQSIRRCCYRRVAALSKRLCPCYNGAHFEHQFQQVYKFSYFVIYLPKLIKLR